MEVECLYCKKSASYTPLSAMEKHGVKIYFCRRCQAEYLYYEGGDRASVSIYTILYDKTYRWTVTRGATSNQPTARLWYVESPGIPGQQPNEGLKLLAKFGHLNPQSPIVPEITPSNIRRKIKTYLMML